MNLCEVQAVAVDAVGDGGADAEVAVLEDSLHAFILLQHFDCEHHGPVPMNTR